MIVRNVMFAPGRHLDVVGPQTSTPVPVVIYVHGGGRISGTKDADLVDHVAARGFCTVSIDYELSTLDNPAVYQTTLVALLVLATGLGSRAGRHVSMVLLLALAVAITCYCTTLHRNVKHPHHVRDVAQAIRWTVDNIATYGGDPARIVLLGHSAGAHLVSLVATNERFCQELAIPSGTIKGVVAMGGVFSDVRFREYQIGSLLLHMSFGDDLADAFPIHNVSKDAPPHFLITAEVEYSLRRHAFDMYFALLEVGAYVRAKTYRGLSHMSLRTNWGGVHSYVLDDVVAFINECVVTA